MQFFIRIPQLADFVARLAQAPDVVAPILARAMSGSQAILAKYTTQDTVPWRTGFLTQSFRAELTNAVLRWFPTASYAPYVEFGTDPHVILPKNGKALMWPGAAHPVARVNHPGTKPNPFMERIVAYAQDDITDLFGEAMTQIIAGMAQ